MARNRFIEADIDFEGIERRMAALDPPKLALEEVLARLRDRMQEQRKRGVTVEQLAGVLREMGVEVGVRNLKHYIEKGQLMGGRPRRGTPAAPEADAGTDRPVAETAGAADAGSQAGV